MTIKRLTNLPAVGLALGLTACVVGFYATRNTGENLAAPAPEASVIDQRLMQTARQVSALAATPEEQDLSREALRLADHELDQAYATALREATAPAAVRPGPLKELTGRIGRIKAGIAAGQQHIAELTKKAETSDTAAGELEMAKALLALDQDELEDAQEDLARQGGDIRARLARAQQEHDNAQRAAAITPAPPLPTAYTLKDQWALWFALGDRDRQMQAARQQASRKTADLVTEHNRLEKAVNNKPAEALPANPTEDTSAVVARFRGLSDQRRTLKEFDGRIEDTQQLADVYRRWSGILEARRAGVVHQMLRLLAWIMAILLGAALIGRAIHGAFRGADRRRQHQARFISRVAVQLAAFAIILLIVFGPPTQLSTIIGLATAGLTVVLKDFIVAFFGWFVLMGRNGVRIGDWVEINGVGGEVIEIGLLKTVLLEMGNWTNGGRPTGRRVGFTNGYAIEGHYFNFSTAGQWLWDELQVTVPKEGDPYGIAERIGEMVKKETAVDAEQAGQDWERVTRQYGTKAFSARPAVDLRPGSGGLEVVVRYITRAPQRYEVKARLYQAIVPLLHKSAAGPQT